MTTPPITPELEKVRKAIQKAARDQNFPFVFTNETAVVLARAALSALLPIGEGVVEAMQDNEWLSAGECEAAFSAAIHSILGEKTE